MRPRLAFAILTLLATSARADGLIPITDAPTAELSKECVDVARTATIGGAKVAIVHDCDDGPERTASLAIHSRDGWFVKFVTTIAHQGANMTEAPLHITLGGESLAGGARHRNGCSLKVMSHEVHDNVLVCTVPGKTIAPAVACTSFTEVCAKSGCGAIAFDRGVLSMIDANGHTVRRTVE